jgi:hypothetical protein
MSLARTTAVAVAVSVWWCATAGAGGPLRPFKHGFWSGGAYTDDRTGAFTHCSAGVAYDSGINLFVLVTGGYRWWLGFINPKWELMPNARISIKLQLDDGAPFNGLASIPSGQLLLVSLPDNSKLLAAFRHSSKLALDAEGQSFSFKLNATPAVMDQLANCVRTSVALEAQAPPPAPSTNIGALGASTSSTTAPPSGSPAVTASGSPATPAEAAPPAAAAAQPQTLPAETATAPLTPAQKSGREAAAGSPSLGPASDSPAQGSTTGGGPPESTTAASPVSAAGAAPTADKAEATVQPRVPPSAAPPLAFTSVAPPPSTPPSAAIASALPLEAATPTSLEEVRLATEFLAKAELPDARLIVADKPPALADFTAVWRSEDAAGAVKIIPPGPDVSGIRIASNLIAVDPQLCNGDFSAARFRNDVGNGVVFSAVLSCTEANEQRVTEYFITPRHQGGFVVFAVIRSKAVDKTPDFDWQKIEMLSRAAIQAAEGQG